MSDDNTDEIEPVADVIDVSVYEGKIAELSASVETHVATIAELENSLTKAKADNYDLLMSAPSEAPEIPDDMPDNPTTEIDLDDLFEK